MTHPLYRSKNGAILWEELPEALRLYDNASDAGPGDLARFIDGFGHLMDRFEATLAQFHADGFAATLGPADTIAPMQSWVLPYVAELFGVTLYGPDPQSRASELAQAIWIARRRGSRLAIDRAAESILGRAVVTVPGLSRTLFSPTLQARLLTHRELTGTPHPLDPLILHDPLGPAGTLSNLRRRHAGLPLGLRDSRTHMRAVATTTVRLGSEFRPVTDPLTGVRTMRRFVIIHPDGIPAFPPATKTARSAAPTSVPPHQPSRRRGPLAPRSGLAARRSATRHLPSGPDAPHDRPHRRGRHYPPPDPAGRHAARRHRLSPPDSQRDRHALPRQRRPRFGPAPHHRPPPRRRTRHRLRHHRHARRLRHLPCDPARGCAADPIQLPDRRVCRRRRHRPDRMEYVTVTRRTAARGLYASDCILMDPVFPAAVPAGGSCIRFSRLGPGAALPAWLRLQKTTRGRFHG